MMLHVCCNNLVYKVSTSNVSCAVDGIKNSATGVFIFLISSISLIILSTNFFERN